MVSKTDRAVEILRGAFKRLKDSWNSGSFTDADSPIDKDASQWCAMGALQAEAARYMTKKEKEEWDFSEERDLPVDGYALALKTLAAMARKEAKKKMYDGVDDDSSVVVNFNDSYRQNSAGEEAVRDIFRKAYLSLLKRKSRRKAKLEAKKPKEEDFITMDELLGGVEARQKVEAN